MSSESFVVAIVSPDRKVHEEVSQALNGNTDVETLWTLTDYPEPGQLAEIRKLTGGCIIFLDFSNPVRAKAVAAELDSYPSATVVAVHSSNRPQELIELMQLGIREIVTVPVKGPDVIQAFLRVSRKLKRPATDDTGGNLYAFMPAKPGCGATTLAAHGAAAAARLANQRTLLIDLDFRLGMTSFLFKLNSSYSVLEVIADLHTLDAEMWDRMVSRKDLLDILGSAPVEFQGLDPEQGVIPLLDFARKTYQVVCVDLPGEMRQYEIDTLHRAKECFLVCTSDIGSLHMARRKAELLRSLGLHGKVSVVMNRVEGRGAMAISDIEAILQLQVRFSIGAFDNEIAEATQNGNVLKGHSPLVTQIETMARRMAGTGAAAPPKTRKFMEMFSVSAARDRAGWGW